MMDNHLYNIVLQLTQEHKSLWRIKNNYQGDSVECEGCKAFWEKMIADKEQHIEELTGMLKEHLG